MAYDESKTCFNCFWEWEDNGFSRCTRMPPNTVLWDKTAIDLTTSMKSIYAPAPGIPACGEWLTREAPEEVIEPPTIQGKE